MTDKQHVDKWLKGELSKEDKAEFEKSKEGQLLASIDNELVSMKAPDFDVDKALEKFNREKSLKPLAKQVQLSWIRPTMKIAASLLVLFVASYLLFFRSNGSQKISADYAQKVEFYLPDSSFVILNAGSTMSYNTDTWVKDRKLTLDGEAYFEVKSGSDFKVKSPSGLVQVLGTKFNVYDRDDYYNVECYHGLVRVESNGYNDKLRLGESVQLFKAKAIRSSINGLESPSWVEDKSAFKSAPLFLVINELERQYNLKVQVENIDINFLFTGVVVHDNLDVALRTISISTNSTYKIIDENTVILERDQP